MLRRKIIDKQGTEAGSDGWVEEGCTSPELCTHNLRVVCIVVITLIVRGYRRYQILEFVAIFQYVYQCDYTMIQKVVKIVTSVTIHTEGC
jgi:hypothetical protein